MNTDNIRNLLRRENLGIWLNENGYKQGVGLEVGTYRGEFAAHLAGQWDCTTLATCDPWEHYEGYLDGCTMDWANNKAPLPLEPLMREAEARLKPFGSKVQIYRMKGIDCLNRYIDGGLSMVYLDGAHDYKTVIAELTLAWRKLEPGGVLGGHDLYWRDDNEQKCGVWPAVWEKAHEWNIMPHVTHCTSYWFIKGK
jgi:hypothetical protein